MQVCRSGAARSFGVRLIYLLMAAQLAILVGGFGTACVWRACCRRRYAPPNPLNDLPVQEVSEWEGGGALAFL